MPAVAPHNRINKMTQNEFLNTLNSHNAFFAAPAAIGQISITNVNLQKIHAATLPKFISDLYQTCGGIKLGNGYIFGPNEFGRPGSHPIPNIFQINNELTNLAKLHAKTVFGRNDLFWFTFDSFGKCYMLDNLGLNVLRRYEDPYRAMLDCLIGGKI